ncbi:MAG: hypothetical protein RLZZ630_1574 [Bacteroidota bacterium]|jgi:hypothetical protein
MVKVQRKLAKADLFVLPAENAIVDQFFVRISHKIDRETPVIYYSSLYPGGEE